MSRRTTRATPADTLFLYTTTARAQMQGKGRVEGQRREHQRPQGKRQPAARPENHWVHNREAPCRPAHRPHELAAIAEVAGRYIDMDQRKIVQCVNGTFCPMPRPAPRRRRATVRPSA